MKKKKTKGQMGRKRFDKMENRTFHPEVVKALRPTVSELPSDTSWLNSGKVFGQRIHPYLARAAYLYYVHQMFAVERPNAEVVTGPNQTLQELKSAFVHALVHKDATFFTDLGFLVSAFKDDKISWNYYEYHCLTEAAYSLALRGRKISESNMRKELRESHNLDFGKELKDRMRKFDLFAFKLMQSQESGEKVD